MFHSHDYDVNPINPVTLTYFAGFVARKCSKWTKCEARLSSCTKPRGDTPEDKIIDNFSRGYLKYPSADLVEVLTALKKGILQSVGQCELEFYTFHHLLSNIQAESLKFIGCDDHKQSLTEKVIKYYVVVRAKIVCKNHNRIFNETREKEREHRKMAKLVSSKKGKDNNEEKEDNEKNNMPACVQKPEKKAMKSVPKKGLEDFISFDCSSCFFLLYTKI